MPASSITRIMPGSIRAPGRSSAPRRRVIDTRYLVSAGAARLAWDRQVVGEQGSSPPLRLRTLATWLTSLDGRPPDRGRERPTVVRLGRIVSSRWTLAVPARGGGAAASGGGVVQADVGRAVRGDDAPVGQDLAGV